MKKINFKHPKYVLPLLLLPFLSLFFYVYHNSAAGKKTNAKEETGMRVTVGDVSDDIKKNELQDKIEAYRNTYKEVDGNTAVTPIPKEQSTNTSFNNPYSAQQKKTLDSIDAAMQQRFASKPAPDIATGHKAMAEALKGLANRHKEKPEASVVPKDKEPMDLFKQQMAYMDSINKANDPNFKAEKLKQETLAREKAKQADETILKVTKSGAHAADFNTVWPEKKEPFMMAVIDENLTGYAGSRIRLRLLENINAGNILVKKGTYIYALINGFSGQRVTLEISSILSDNKILPVKLDVYDLDGLPGLYVPESAFRDFTKDLGSNSIQGVNIDGSSANGSQFLMSTASKLFESTSTAIAGMIRKNKAKIKYNSYLYLIDNEALQNAQKREALLSTDKKQ
ncbi:conjugative transposon protein TraM [Mucilaginibacter sp. FT3.2]|uniref:conjugative transposon protein TraM n=1 Tax=Mucilaginibacter sp. FT3.2 TaxID=2723090 RepID=UPI001620C122|nr:conjugative transposon protein TraM [Mucilaginibacter sp. FT3.2]MBB6234281.1 conjugative transposon TraM protein [Mucilaginibacter sp. FT3.2]